MPFGGMEFTTVVQLSEEQEQLLKSLSPEQLSALERRVADMIQASADAALFALFCPEPKTQERPAGLLGGIVRTDIS